MFSNITYKTRRQKLSKSIENGLIFISGNNHCPRNYPANTYPFRQDSNFLYFTGIDLPGLALIIDCSSGESTLYGDDISVEDSIWTGQQPSLVEWAGKAGIEHVKASGQLKTDIQKATQIHYLPVYPNDRKIFFAELFQKHVKEISEGHSIKLIQAIVNLRSIKSDEEIFQMEDALNTATSKFHVDAMKMAMPGVMEYQIAGHIESTMLKNNCSAAYGTICSVRGEILHNEYYNNELKKDQLLLVDAGAENNMHYASDITRTTPVGGKFSQQQKGVYNIVLQALNKSIEAIKPGINYRDIHLNAAKIIASGLKELGLMKGDINEAVRSGAHAMFFPHGLGHMIGLDVHDMEDLGEDNVGYDSTIKRSEQFGTAFLRLGRKLEVGFVITVEPGIYFIPELIQKWKLEGKFTEYINYSEAEKYLNFGGIRIEDNILVSKKGGRVIGNPIPKEISDIENLF